MPKSAILIYMSLPTRHFIVAKSQWMKFLGLRYFISLAICVVIFVKVLAQRQGLPFLYFLNFLRDDWVHTIVGVGRKAGGVGQARVINDVVSE